MRESLKIHALHGFLGNAEDWSILKSGADRPFVLECENLQFQSEDFSSWSEAFQKKIFNRPVLLGYSMGGRLAMQVICAFPQLFSGAILVSAHPGLAEDAIQERSARRASDEAWARRFENVADEDWETLLGEWNAQSVLQGGGQAPLRKEREYDRAVLAQQLRVWSLGRQKDLLPTLAQVSVPILWIAGERDVKYAGLAREVGKKLGQRAPAETWIVSDAGHRVPWDQSEPFKRKVQDWIFEVVLGR